MQTKQDSINEWKEYLFPKSFVHPTIIDHELIIRPLHINDYQKGFCQVLSQLTEIGTVTNEQFLERFRAMQKERDTYFVVVVEDVTKKRIVGAGTVAVEMKFIRGCSKCGHIEDIVVDETYRGKNLGKIIITRLKEIGEMVGCYKIVLDCSEKNVEFYKRCGFQQKEIQMVCYLNKSSSL